MTVLLDAMTDPGPQPHGGPRPGAAAEPRTERVVRVRSGAGPDAERCREVLTAAGLAPEDSLTWVVVRDADPDAVNALLVQGGAVGRVVIREAIGKLVGWLLDRQGDLSGRARNVKSLVERVVSDAGLKEDYAPKSDDALLAAASAEYERLVATGAAMLTWAEFVERFLEPRPRAAAPPAAG